MLPRRGSSREAGEGVEGRRVRGLQPPPALRATSPCGGGSMSVAHHEDPAARPWETIRRGMMLLVSSPTGAGKTSLSRRLVADHSDLVLSISATTRAPRPGEE